MKAKKPTGSKKVTGLRRQAEELPRPAKRNVTTIPGKDVQQLVHELQVHQIELETQNEELRRTKMELEAARTLYEDLYDFAPAGHLTLDTHGTILEGNSRAVTLLGVNWKELIGQPLVRFIASSDEGTFHRHCQEVLKTGTRQTCEVFFRNEAGVSRWICCESLAVHDESGHITHVRTALLDVSERKQAEATRLEALSTLDAIVDGAFIFDPQTLRFSYANEGAVRQVGYSHEELLRMTPLDLKPEFDEPRFRAMIAPLVSGAESARSFTTVHRRKDGMDLPVEINLQCVEVGTARARLIAIVRDITERKRAEDEIRRHGQLIEAANKELESFSYSISHDLQTPLRSIDGFSQALLEDCAGLLNEQGKDYLNRIRAASQRMRQLIDDLLNLSRTARHEMRRKSVDLSALALGCAADARKIWPGRQVELVVAPGLQAQGDQRLLQIVFDNLLGNAWKFTSKQERAVIEVGTRSHDGTTAYFVRDNGAGFDMAYVDKLFAPFQRLHAMTEYSGTGIGLATVRRIIARHGGLVWAEGLVGQGATFYFTLGKENAE